MNEMNFKIIHIRLQDELGIARRHERYLSMRLAHPGSMHSAWFLIVVQRCCQITWADPIAD